MIETGFYGLDATRFSPVRVTVKGVTYYGYLDANQPALDQAQIAAVRPGPQLGQHRVTVLAHSGASYPIIRRRPA